ncbi:MAG: Fic family protein [Candidatus Peregrinibacteria bacterium]
MTNDHLGTSRYSVGGSENAYMDTGRRVMRNLNGIIVLKELQKAEEDALVHAYQALLGEVRSDTPMSNALLKHIHHSIFGDLYDWAGRFRTVVISKPGVTWPPPDYLDQAMKEYERDVLRKYPASSIQENDDAFCKALAHIQGEFLAIHPFREGNARSIKLLTDLLSAQTKRPILRYNMTPTGKKRYIAAAKAALIKQDYLLMEAVIHEALTNATKPS